MDECPPHLMLVHEILFVLVCMETRSDADLKDRTREGEQLQCQASQAVNALLNP